MTRAIVLDARGRRLSDTSEERARRLLAGGRATLVSENPLTIRLNYRVEIPAPPPPQEEKLPGEGRRILLHICCAPCATYTVNRLREQGFAVTGYWYNPNIHPFSEHERRRDTLAQYAPQVSLPMIWEPGYEMVEFLRSVVGRERFRNRCRVCYRMRLERTARTAAREGFDAFTTTLLISPYQDQKGIREIGDLLAAQYGVPFYFENMRRGWRKHYELTREYGLYSQRYCGCIYSEWESLDRQATTYTRDK